MGAYTSAGEMEERAMPGRAIRLLRCHRPSGRVVPPLRRCSGAPLPFPSTSPNSATHHRMNHRCGND